MIDILRPIIIATQCMLLIPYKYTVKSGEYYAHFNKPLLVVLGIFISFYIRCIYVITQTKETVVGHFNGTILFKIGDLFRIYSNTFTVIVIASSIFVNKHLYCVILTLLRDIDKNFTLLGVDKHYERIKYKPYIGLGAIWAVFNLSFIINDTLAGYWDSKPTVYLWIAILIPCNVATYYVAMYCTVVMCLDHNLKILNGEIDKMSKNEAYSLFNNIYKSSQLMTDEIKKNFIWKTRRDLQLERLTMLWATYDAICDAASNLNRLFGLRILAIFSVSFTSLVFNSFFVWSIYVNILHGKNTTKNYTFLIYCIQEIILHWANITITVYICNSVKKQVIHKII